MCGQRQLRKKGSNKQQGIGNTMQGILFKEGKYEYQCPFVHRLCRPCQRRSTAGLPHETPRRIAEGLPSVQRFKCKTNIRFPALLPEACLSRPQHYPLWWGSDRCKVNLNMITFVETPWSSQLIPQTFFCEMSCENRTALFTK